MNYTGGQHARSYHHAFDRYCSCGTGYLISLDRLAALILGAAMLYWIV